MKAVDFINLQEQAPSREMSEMLGLADRFNINPDSPRAEQDLYKAIDKYYDDEIAGVKDRANALPRDRKQMKKALLDRIPSLRRLQRYDLRHVEKAFDQKLGRVPRQPGQTSTEPTSRPSQSSTGTATSSTPSSQTSSQTSTQQSSSSTRPKQPAFKKLESAHDILERRLGALANSPIFKFIGVGVVARSMIMILSDYNAYLLGIQRVPENNVQGAPCDIAGYDGYLDDYVDVDLENQNQQFKVIKYTKDGKTFSADKYSITKRISDELFALLPTVLAGTAAWIGIIRGVGVAAGAVLASSGLGIFAGVVVLIVTTGAAWLITMLINKFIKHFEKEGRMLTNPLASMAMERFISDGYANEVCKGSVGTAIGDMPVTVPGVQDLMPSISINEARQAYENQENDMTISNSSEFKMNRQDAMGLENMFEVIITGMLDELQGPRRAELERLIQRSAAMQNQNKDDERVA
jgi:hypothetical protein